MASGQSVLAEASGRSHLAIASGQSVGQSLSPSVPIAVSASISVTICPLPFPLRHALLVSRSTQSFRLLISVRPPYIPPSLYISACDVAVSSAVFLMASSALPNTASAYATAVALEPVHAPSMPAPDPRDLYHGTVLLSAWFHDFEAYTTVSRIEPVPDDAWYNLLLVHCYSYQPMRDFLNCLPTRRYSSLSCLQDAVASAMFPSGQRLYQLPYVTQYYSLQGLPSPDDPFAVLHAQRRLLSFFPRDLVPSPDMQIHIFFKAISSYLQTLMITADVQSLTDAEQLLRRLQHHQRLQPHRLLSPSPAAFPRSLPSSVVSASLPVTALATTLPSTPSSTSSVQPGQCEHCYAGHRRAWRLHAFADCPHHPCRTIRLANRAKQAHPASPSTPSCVSLV